MSPVKELLEAVKRGVELSRLRSMDPKNPNKYLKLMSLCRGCRHRVKDRCTNPKPTFHYRFENSECGGFERRTS